METAQLRIIGNNEFVLKIMAFTVWELVKNFWEVIASLLGGELVLTKIAQLGTTSAM